MTTMWHEGIQSEMVWHLSVKQGLDKARDTEMWALSSGNSRGLKKAQKQFYHANDKEEAMNALRGSVKSALSRYRDGEAIIETSDDHTPGEKLDEGYIQGLLRAWIIATDDEGKSFEERQQAGPPQDLSGSGYKELTEVK